MKEKSVLQSVQEYGRGIIGGLLFSLPMLYTMEVWFTSFNTSPLQIMLYMVVVFILLLAYNRYAGLRENASWKEVAIDSVEEMGLGIVLSFVFLLLLGRFNFSDYSLERIIYMVLVEAMPVAIGVSVGTAQLGASPEEDVETASEEPSGQGHKDANPDQQKGGYRTGESTTLEHILLSACAGMLFAANIAPTDEVPEIAYALTSVRLMLLLLASFLLNGIVLFYIDFRGSYETPANESPSLFQVIWDTSLTYATALCISAGALWFFGRFEGSSLYVGMEMTVVLSIVSSLGASAGRFLLDQEYK